MYICMYILSGVMSGMGIYFATYQLKNASLPGVLNMANRFPFIIALPLLPEEPGNRRRHAISAQVRVPARLETPCFFF